MLVVLYPVYGLVISPPHRAFIATVFAAGEERAPAAIAITRNTMVTINVKIPYGIAKQGFFNLPVAHPRRAIRIPKIPIATFPFPIPAPSSIPGIFNYFFCYSVIGTFPDYIKPKMTIMSAIKPIRPRTLR